MHFSKELKCELDFEGLGRAVSWAVRSEWRPLLHKSIFPVLVGRTPALARGSPSLLPSPISAQMGSLRPPRAPAQGRAPQTETGRLGNKVSLRTGPGLCGIGLSAPTQQSRKGKAAGSRFTVPHAKGRQGALLYTAKPLPFPGLLPITPI